MTDPVSAGRSLPSCQSPPSPPHRIHDMTQYGHACRQQLRVNLVGCPAARKPVVRNFHGGCPHGGELEGRQPRKAPSAFNVRVANAPYRRVEIFRFFISASFWMVVSRRITCTYSAPAVMAVGFGPDLQRPALLIQGFQPVELIKFIILFI